MYLSVFSVLVFSHLPLSPFAQCYFPDGNAVVNEHQPCRISVGSEASGQPTTALAAYLINEGVVGGPVGVNQSVNGHQVPRLLLSR